MPTSLGLTRDHELSLLLQEYRFVTFSFPCDICNVFVLPFQDTVFLLVRFSKQGLPHLPDVPPHRRQLVILHRRSLVLHVNWCLLLSLLELPPLFLHSLRALFRRVPVLQWAVKEGDVGRYGVEAYANLDTECVPVKLFLSGGSPPCDGSLLCECGGQAGGVVPRSLSQSMMRLQDVHAIANVHKTCLQ